MEHHNIAVNGVQTLTTKASSSLYQCFHLSDFEDEFDSSQSSYSYVSAVGIEGKTIHVCQFETENGTVNLERAIAVRSWSINGIDPPALERKSVISRVDDDVRPTLFSTPATQILSLIPKPASTFRPAVVQVSPTGQTIRIGSSIVQVPSTPEPTTDKEGTEWSDGPRALTEYWEESSSTSSISVFARRRWPKQPNLLDATSESERVEKLRELTASRRTQRDPIDYAYSSDDDSYRDPIYPNSERALSDNMSLPSQKSSEKDFKDTASFHSMSDFSANSLNSLASKSADSKSSRSRKSLLSIDLIEDSRTASSTSSIMGISDMSSEVSDIESLRSALSDASDEEDADEEVDAPAADAAVWKGEDVELALEGQYDYNIRTNYENYSYKICDACEVGLETWYYCKFCEPVSTFDLCSNCIMIQGHWCYDKRHKMYLQDKDGIYRALAWNEFSICQEISVLDENANPKRELLYHQEAEFAMLHESPPVIHPTLPLIAWPLTSERLFLANYSQRRERSHQPLRPTNRKAVQICVSLNFSSCGSYLHVGTIEATKVQPDQSNPTEQVGKVSKRYELVFRVTSLQLAQEQPAKNRLKIVTDQSHKLGLWNNRKLTVLPFTWTWSSGHVYFTVNDEKLRIYKVQLPPSSFLVEKDQGQRLSVPSYATLDEDMALPCTTTHRSVNYFPPQDGENSRSTIVVGAGHGEDNGPPIVMYFDEHNLDMWKTLPVVDNQASAPTKKQKDVALPRR